LNNIRFIERLQSGLACPRLTFVGRKGRSGQRHAAPYCVFTSTLERENWRGELPERARSTQKDAVPQGTCEHGFK
jgi:hypothetical protein